MIVGALRGACRYRWRSLIWPGIGLIRHTHARSGQADGRLQWPSVGRTGQGSPARRCLFEGPAARIMRSEPCGLFLLKRPKHELSSGGILWHDDRASIYMRDIPAIRLLPSRNYSPSTTPPSPRSTMSTEWSLDFCLVCDRQTLGGPYCSQSCRLVELDRPAPEDDRATNTYSHSRSSTVESTEAQSALTLSASSSQTSLSSLRSQASSATLSDHLQDELRDYASSFDPVRDLKRRMTTT